MMWGGGGTYSGPWDWIITAGIVLTVVPAVHHEGVDQPLNNGALGLPEPLSGEPDQ